jgi:carboxyl-terminal processing protease
MRLKKVISDILPLLITAVVVAGGAYYIGYEKGAENPQNIIVKGITNIEDDDVSADFGVFWQAWHIIKEEHIDGADSDDKELMYGSISGMLKGLHDPNTVFFPAADAQKFQEDIQGSFAGIGAEIGIRNDRLVIVAPLKNSPAERIGLVAGDWIIAVDEEPTQDVNINDAVKMIRGEEGVAVVLLIFRDGWDGPKDFTIVREHIQIPTLDYEITEDGIVHLKMYSFNGNSLQLFYEAMAESLLGSAKGLVLDLRNNPGGFLDVAVNLAGWFVERGSVVVSEEFRSGAREPFMVSGNEILKDFPTVVLINGGSASASEILAGALRDLNGVPIVGEQSFGKGTVQQLKTLKDSSSLKVTIARWLLPNGGVIEKNGLTPDYVVEITDEDREAGNDPQLEKALELLRDEIELAKAGS